MTPSEAREQNSAINDADHLSYAKRSRKSMCTNILSLCPYSATDLCYCYIFMYIHEKYNNIHEKSYTFSLTCKMNLTVALASCVATDYSYNNHERIKSNDNFKIKH